MTIRGNQYTSDDYRELLDKQGIQCSMSGRGNCYDNAVVESFFGVLKRERLIGYLGNISPVAFEERTCGRFQMVH